MNRDALRDSLRRVYFSSVEDCRRSIIDCLPAGSGGTLLDCGCADGALTRRFAQRLGAERTVGIELPGGLADQAQARGIELVSSDLNSEFAIADATIDVATANQVIEHLYDTDRFLRELHRVLKPGGTLVLSTNNLASWHNIVALLVGAQPFPSDVSSNSGIGKLVRLFPGDPGSYDSWSHLRIFTHRALDELLTYHGFTVRRAMGVGYYPLPPRVGNRLAARRPRHAAYLTVSCSKS